MADGVSADLCQRRASGEIPALHLRRVYERISRRQPGSRFRRRGAHPGVLIASAARVPRPLQYIREKLTAVATRNTPISVMSSFVYPAVAIVSRARSIWFCGERPTSFQPGSDDARPDEGVSRLPRRPVTLANRRTAPI